MRPFSCGRDRDYLDNMMRGLRLWVEAGRRGHLQWGILHFHKPSGGAAAGGVSS